MHRVLASPADFYISNKRYGKTYNLLANLENPRYTIDAYVSKALSDVGSESVTIHELNCSRKVTYYVKAFALARKKLKSGSVDLYHHMNLSYRWFNPLLLAGVQEETPVVLGPCQTGHFIMPDEFQILLSRNTDIDIPRFVSNALYSCVSASRDVLLDPIRSQLFARTLREADRIVVVHEQAKQQYAEFVDESKIDVIPLGVDANEFSFVERSRTKEFVAIGRLRERKAYDILINSLAEVKSTHPDVHLHIFGEGPLEEQLRRQTIEVGVVDNVTFHGFVDQSVIKEHLGRARAFVHPSHSESFSLVRLEAMAVGCPIICSDIHGAHEMVRDGKEGFVIPSGSADELTEAMVKLLEDFELAEVIGRNARSRVEQRYDWQQIAQQYIEVYDDLLC